MKTTHQITVAKAEEAEVSNLQEFIQKLSDVIKENEQYEEDDDINKEIADAAKTLPSRAFIVPLNCQILLDNYQDKESDILKHPKWIMDLYSILEEVDEYSSSNPQNYIGSGSILHTKIKEALV